MQYTVAGYMLLKMQAYTIVPAVMLPGVDPSHGQHMLDEQRSMMHFQMPQCVHVSFVHAGYSKRHSWKGQPGCQPLKLYQSGVSTAVWHII